MQAWRPATPGGCKAYEIWNEENLGNETGPDHWHPDKYAEMLKAGYLGVKAGDPSAVVISGALTPTGVYNDDAVEDTWFLDQLYQWNNGEIRNYYDVLGMHPYGYWNPPDTMYPVTPAVGPDARRRIQEPRLVLLPPHRGPARRHGEARRRRRSRSG